MRGFCVRFFERQRRRVGLFLPEQHISFMHLIKLARRLGASFTLLGLPFASVLAADEEANSSAPAGGKTETTPEVVVSATRNETPVDAIAASVTVIGRQEIEDKQYYFLSSALRDVPGLAFADRGSPGSVSGIFMRGTKSEHTSVLLDGRPLPANLAGLFNLESLTLDNIERVEVLRGPASSLYGGKAIGGVINLISRTGKGLDKPEGSLSFEGGSHDTFREALTFRGSDGSLDYSLELNRFDTGGERINSDYELTSGAGHLGVQATEDLYFSLDLRVFDSAAGVPGPATGFGANDPDDLLESSLWSLSPKAVWQTTDRWKQTLSYQFSSFEQEASHFNYFGGNNRIEVENHHLEYQSEIDMTEHWKVTLGGIYQDRHFERYNDDALLTDVDADEKNWALFVQSQLRIAKDLHLIASLRHDDYSAFDEATTGRAGVSYRIPMARTLLHANYGTAFSPPSPQDVQPALYGNPYLVESEESEGWEIGVEQPFWEDKGKIFLTWFRNDIENLIEYDPVSFSLHQVDEARTEGVEVGFQLNPVKQLRLDANYTWLDAENLTQDVRLVRRPRHQLNAGIAWLPVENLRFGLNVNYVADREDGFGAEQREVDDFTTVRLTAAWKITKHVEIFGRIDNLLDEEYEEVLGYPAYGRTFYAGLRLRF